MKRIRSVITLNKSFFALEGLLKDRINFYLLFASVFLLGLARIDPDGPTRVVALGIMSVVSLLIGLAILRTHMLVQQALNDIIKHGGPHPYRRYRANIKLLPNANKILILVPVVLTICFMGATVFYFCRLP